MALTQAQDGSQSATIDTRHQLGSTITTAGVYLLIVDLNAMTNGDSSNAADETLLEVEIMTRSGGTRRLAYSTKFFGAQIEKIAVSVPIPVAHEVAFFLTQTDGVGRAFPWSICSS